MPELTEEDVKNMSPEQLIELQKQNCIFCQILSGKIPAKKVYEDEICLAIIDINPASKGHVLLIPKEHYAILPQAPENVIRHIGKISKVLSRAMISGLASEGTNIFIANGGIAGQRATHSMVHIIPRNEGDGISCFELPEKEIRPEDMERIQSKLSGKPSNKTEKRLEEIDLDQLKDMLK